MFKPKGHRKSGSHTQIPFVATQNASADRTIGTGCQIILSDCEVQILVQLPERMKDGHGSEKVCRY